MVNLNPLRPGQSLCYPVCHIHLLVYTPRVEWEEVVRLKGKHHWPIGHYFHHDVGSVAVTISSPDIAIITNPYNLFNIWEGLVCGWALRLLPNILLEAFLIKEILGPKPAYKGRITSITTLIVEVTVKYLLYWERVHLCLRVSYFYPEVQHRHCWNGITWPTVFLWAGTRHIIQSLWPI